jgi:hypothetical protein
VASISGLFRPSKPKVRLRRVSISAPIRRIDPTAVEEAASALVRQRFLLIEDYDRMVGTALQKGTDLWKTPR